MTHLVEQGDRLVVIANQPYVSIVDQIAAAVAAESARCVAVLNERADWWDSIAKAHEGGKRKAQANRCCLRALELREAARVLAKGVVS